VARTVRKRGAATPLHARDFALFITADFHVREKNITIPLRQSIIHRCIFYGPIFSHTGNTGTADTL